MRRPRAEIVCAVRRVVREKLETCDELAPLLGHPPAVVRRWIVSGCRSVYLDGVSKPGLGWLSSHAACLRFLRELWERDELEHERLLGEAAGALERAADLAARGVAVADCSVMRPAG